MGMSWMAMAYVVWCVIHKKNFHVYITSVGLKEVQEQMERIRFIYWNLPQHIRDQAVLGGKNCKDNDSLIQFTNGSAIHAISSSKAAGHGSAPGLYILDEFARKENDVIAWRAIRPSIGKNTQVFIISTSDGFNNLYAELWFDASSGANDFIPVFFAADRHPDYTPEYLAEQKREFAGDLEGYMQAFPMKPEDAFLSSSRTIFDIERVREWKEYIRENNITYRTGRLDEVPTTDKRGRQETKIVFEEDEKARFVMWKEPVAGHNYVVGVDVAEGLVHGDWSVLVVLDTDTDEIVAMLRAKIAPEEWAFPVLTAAKFYNNAWLVVEVNKNADLLMSDIKVSYPFVYCRPVREKITDKPTLVPGFITSGSSKPRIIQQMRRYFSSEERPLKIYSDTILDEMASFEENNGKLEAVRGLHDDCVMAVALAIEGKTTMPTQRPGVGMEKKDPFRQTRKRSWRSL